MTDIIVVGLGFGDEGKGTIVDYLSRQNPDATVIRFNGGAQAAHNVITPDGRHHTFAQFGSGTLAGARTHLSEHMLVNPTNMMNEATILAANTGVFDVFDRLTVDPAALVTTRFHMAWNRIEEITRTHNAHGSCGQGIGATVEYSLKAPGANRVLRAGHLRDPDHTRHLLTQLRNHYVGRLSQTPLFCTNETEEILNYEVDLIRGGLDLDRLIDTYRHWAELVDFRLTGDLTGDFIFEGAQGILLDEKFGTAPHHTWSNCTPHNAQEILNRHFARPRAKVIGVCRTYMTRHGAGPLPTETRSIVRPEAHNGTGRYQGSWRVGHLDAALLKYSISKCTGVNRVDEIAVTHMDRLDAHQPVSVDYGVRLDRLDSLGYLLNRYDTWARPKFIPKLTEHLDRPVSIVSHGPTADDKESMCAF